MAGNCWVLKKKQKQFIDSLSIKSLENDPDGIFGGSRVQSSGAEVVRPFYRSSVGLFSGTFGIFFSDFQGSPLFLHPF